MSEEIVAFLRARLTERSESAASVHDSNCPGLRDGACDCGSPSLLRSGIDAMMRELDSLDETAPGTPEYNGYLYLCRQWASGFSGHRDFQERWRPTV